MFVDQLTVPLQTLFPKPAEQPKQDCYDKYTLNRCDISSSNYSASASYKEGDEVTVTFTAFMTEKGAGGKTNSFEEVSTFRREDIGGGNLGWLYQFGDVD
jgi:uncharacterized protein YchJ